MYVDKEERTLIEQHIESVTCMDLPLDWDNLYDADVRAQGVHTESISDALVICLNTLGMVDIEYISSITGADYKTVICALKGSIYQNPDTWGECFFMGWETAEEYLSGNLMNKWKVAKEVNEYYSGYFEDNVKAIEKVIPAPVATKDIYITLGSPWVPTDVIDDFISYLLGEGGRRKKYSIYRDFSFCRVVHDEITGTWEIPNKSYYKYEWGVTNVFGTEKIGALSTELLESINYRIIVLLLRPVTELRISRWLSRCQKHLPIVCFILKWRGILTHGKDGQSAQA